MKRLIVQLEGPGIVSAQTIGTVRTGKPNRPEPNRLGPEPNMLSVRFRETEPAANRLGTEPNMLSVPWNRTDPE